MVNALDTTTASSTPDATQGPLEPASLATQPFRYRAFITYSHKDSRIAEWLHKAIERYAVPKSLIGQPGRDGPIPPKLFPLFRDRDELSSSHDLTAAIREALRQSANLIVLCSPASANSRWVNEEIMEFKRLGGTNRIHALIIDGDPSLGSGSGGCYPPALCAAISADGTLDTSKPVEPLAADIRSDGDGKGDAKLKLISGLLGISFDSLRRREAVAARARRRVVQSVAAAMLLLGLIGAFAGYQAYINRQMAALRMIPGVRLEKRETTLDLSGWQPTTEAELAGGVKKSRAVSHNKYTIVKIHDYATTFVHVAGSSSGITPEIFCDGKCSMRPREIGNDRRTPNEYEIEFNIEKIPVNGKTDIEFDFVFWNAFQRPTQWWGGFRILQSTEVALYSIKFPTSHQPLKETLEYAYYDTDWRPYSEDVMATVANNDGRVEKVTWKVPHPLNDRSYRIKWDWGK